jgi:predicted phosphoadenosine phosphosulfate sulfurtransferase
MNHKSKIIFVMPKKYLDINVYEALVERIEYIFGEFELVYLSVSGGKDSSVMIQLTNKIAKRLNRSFDVYYVDLEAQYTATINHMEELKKLSQIRDFYHLCLPLSLTNASSILQPKCICWDEKDKNKWVRNMPSGCINQYNHPFGDYFVYGMEFESFMKKFPKWLMKKHNCEKVAGLVAIRTDESLNRFRAISFSQSRYNDCVYSTDNGGGYYSFYPIYDWKTQDIWHAVSKFNLMFNEVYEMLWKNGVSIHDQRICHPYGADQRVSLNQWAVLEPDTWHKVVNRVSGTNFGNIYCKTSLLGHHGSEKPEHLSWQEYAVFLLESIGLYSPTLMKHYVRKLKIFFKYHYDNYNIEIKDIPDFRSPKESKERGKGIHWKRIARCLEKNDFACTSLSYGLTVPDIEDAKKLRIEWEDALGIPENTKVMRTLKEKVYED